LRRQKKANNVMKWKGKIKERNKQTHKDSLFIAKGKTGCWFVDATLIKHLGLTDELCCVLVSGKTSHQSKGEKRKTDIDNQQRDNTKRTKLNGNLTQQE
jgi:hypothetical protein